MEDHEDNEKFHTVTSRWSDSIENVIKSVGESCEGYKWMNIFAAKKASKSYNTLMYSLIFIGPIAGIFSTISTVDNERSPTIQILVTVFSFLSGVLSAIIKFSKFEQKTSSHKNMAAKYASLEGNIRRQLSLYRNERVNAGDYLEWVTISFDDLFVSNPLMSDSIYQKWVEFAKKNGLIIPKQIGQIIEIEDNEDHISHLANVGKIDINKSDSDETINEDKVEIVVKGTNTIKREKKKRQREAVYTPTSELNKFTDKAMKYELSRLYRMPQ